MKLPFLLLDAGEMVVAEEVEEPVDGQQAELVVEAVALRPGLAEGERYGDNDIAQVELAVGPLLAEREAQDVGRAVLLHELAVERLDGPFAREGQADLGLDQPVARRELPKEALKRLDPDLVFSLAVEDGDHGSFCCLLYTSPSPRDGLLSRMPSSA